MQKLVVGPYGNGDIQELDVNVSVGAAPPVNTQPHTVTFGKPGSAQTKVTLTLGAVTPPAPPPPPADGPDIPAGLVKVGAKIFDSVDPTSGYWDIGAGGLQVFGSMNGVTCNPSLAKLANGVLAMTTDGNGHGATITTLPLHDPTNGRPGTGAATGFSYTAAVVELVAQWSGSGVADAWDGGWSQAVSQKGGSPYQPVGGEYDFVEMARWPGGAGNATASYHYGVANDTNPNGISLGPCIDGKPHKHTLIRTQTDCWVLRDGVVIDEFPCKDNLAPHFLILSKGAGNASTSQFFSLRVWGITP